MERTAAEQELLAEWIRALSVMHIAHHKAASYFGFFHLFLGISVVVASAVLGASIGELVFGPNSGTGKLFTGAIGMLSAVFAGIQTFVDPGARSRTHHGSAAAFAEARRELEQLNVTGGGGNFGRQLDDVRKKWNAALKAAPNLPSFIHSPVRTSIDRLH